MATLNLMGILSGVGWGIGHYLELGRVEGRGSIVISHSCPSIFAGTFAVVELMIGNSIEKVFNADEDLMENCMDMMNLTDDSFQFYYKDQLTTCDEVRTDIIVTVALLSGIFMVRGVV